MIPMILIMPSSSIPFNLFGDQTDEEKEKEGLKGKKSLKKKESKDKKVSSETFFMGKKKPQ